MLLAELLLELSSVDDITSWLESLGSFPPSSCRSSEIVGCIQHFLILSHSSNFQIVVDGAKSIIGLQWVKSLGVGGWVGLLKITQGRSLVSIAIAVTTIVAVVVIVVVVVVVISGCELL